MFINTCTKRGNGKRIVDLGIKDAYEAYATREKNRQRKPKAYPIYKAILKEANLMIRDSIILENEPVKLPYRIGKLWVRKYKVNFNPDKKNFWRVDYNRSSIESEKRQEKIIVYYDQEYRYRIMWNKGHPHDFRGIKGKRFYTFYPCRTANRLIAKALRENSKLDYCEKVVR